ncbi:MAG: NAD-dependent epimerase/dehydratase family protein, partial [Bryobacteraceae bacterium]
MSLIFVTGASGFVGWHVANLLLMRGDRVRALCRPSSQIRELNVECVSGDLRDPDSLARAVSGCDSVFHVAADYRLWSKHPDELYRSNVEGTRNVLEAAAHAGVRRIVYTSTVGCIGMPKHALGDENTPVSIEDMTGDYKRSKWLAEQAVLEKARQGLPVVIVNPTAPMGDRDRKPTPTGQIIVDFMLGKMPGFVDTGLNVVDVRDVAAGHLLAAERGREGER